MVKGRQETASPRGESASRRSLVKIGVRRLAAEKTSISRGALTRSRRSLPASCRISLVVGRRIAPPSRAACGRPPADVRGASVGWPRQAERPPLVSSLFLYMSCFSASALSVLFLHSIASLRENNHLLLCVFFSVNYLVPESIRGSDSWRSHS